MQQSPKEEKNIGKSLKSPSTQPVQTVAKKSDDDLDNKPKSVAETDSTADSGADVDAMLDVEERQKRAREKALRASGKLQDQPVKPEEPQT